jgi:hypothetical protein
MIYLTNPTGKVIWRKVNIFVSKYKLAIKPNKHSKVYSLANFFAFKIDWVSLKSTYFITISLYMNTINKNCFLTKKNLQKTKFGIKKNLLYNKKVKLEKAQKLVLYKTSNISKILTYLNTKEVFQLSSFIFCSWPTKIEQSVSTWL